MPGLKIGRNRVASICVFLGVGLALATPAYADCSAYAEPAGSAQITDGGDVFGSLRVTAKPCRDGCYGYVNFFVHYLYQDGYGDSYISTEEYRSDAGEPVRITFKGYESHCNVRNSGPCTVYEVEIVKVSCYD